jgi:hypothetical protein
MNAAAAPAATQNRTSLLEQKTELREVMVGASLQTSSTQREPAPRVPLAGLRLSMRWVQAGSASV